MQLFREELALANLRCEINEDERGHMSREKAYLILKELSGRDYGYDDAAWERWVKDQGLPSKTDGA